MGFSLTKEHLNRLREKLHEIDELHARVGGVEPVDPKETFFEALGKRKAQGSRSEFSGEDILLKLQRTKAEISEELQEAIQRLQMELNEQFSMLIKEGRSGAEIVQNLMKSSRDIEPASYSARMSQEDSRAKSEESFQILSQDLDNFIIRYRKTEKENEKRHIEIRREMKDIDDKIEFLINSFEKSKKESSQTEKIDATKLNEYIDSRLNEYARELRKEVEKLQKENILLKATLDAEKEKNQKK